MTWTALDLGDAPEGHVEDEVATMPSRIKRYHVVEFGNYPDFAQFRDALMSFVTTQQGLKDMADDPRCVVWVPDTVVAPGKDLLYLSPGAVGAATEAGLLFVTVGEMTADELPEERSLLGGEAPDWEQE